jgi:hypothetical protein
MSVRASRTRTRSTTNSISNRANTTGNHVESSRSIVPLPAPAANRRNRSRSSLDKDLPENWLASRLLSELKTLNCNLPPSTAHKTLVRVYKRLQSSDSSSTEGAPLTDHVIRDDNRNTSEFAERRAQSPVQNGVDLFPDRPSPAAVPPSSEMDALRRDMASVQATLAEVSRTLAARNTAVSPDSAGMVNSIINDSVESHVPVASAPTLAFSTVTARVAIDSLPPINIVTSKVRADIHAHKYVNLALLLIPGMDPNDQTQITDSDGTQIVVKASDARLNRISTRVLPLCGSGV